MVTGRHHQLERVAGLCLDDQELTLEVRDQEEGDSSLSLPAMKGSGQLGPRPSTQRGLQAVERRGHLSQHPHAGEGPRLLGKVAVGQF